MAEPISMAEAKKHLRVDKSADDNLIAGNIIAAREWVEDYTGLILSRRVVTEALTGFADRTKLRAWPIADGEPVTITYRDTFGAEQTIVDATLQALARPCLIYPAAGTRWPLNRTVSGDPYVTFTAGYADAADVPQVLRQAMLVMLTAFYEDREGGELFALAEASARNLCRRHKRRTL